MDRKRMRGLLAAAALLFSVAAQAQESAGGADAAGHEDGGEETPGQAAGRYGRAVGEAVFANLVVNGMDRLGGAEFARVTPWTVHHNLTHPWIWDRDGYLINNLGHPYQGSLYFAAGRANDLPMWQSLLLGAFGSATWEIAGENSTPSLNDLVYTPLGGMAYGEILHRLYYEAFDAIGGFALFVSPMDALNCLLTRRRPAPPEHGAGHVTELAVGASAGGGAVATRAAGESAVQAYPICIRPRLSLVYGDPYGLETAVPYRHFDLDIQGGAGAGRRVFYEARVLTSGTLLAYAPDSGAGTDTTLELAFDYDTLFTPDIYFSAFTLGAQLRQRRQGAAAVTSYTLGVGVVPLCASDYFYLLHEDIPLSGAEEDSRTYNYGCGMALKALLRVELPGVRALDAGARVLGRYIIPAAEASNASDGVELVGMASVEARQHIAGAFFLGTGVECYGKLGRYDDAPDVYQLAIAGYVSFSARF